MQFIAMLLISSIAISIDARYQVSWHPGWKDHMLKGRMIGHLLINALEDALFDLDLMRTQHGDDPLEVLAHLQDLDLRDRQLFQQQPPDSKVWDDDRAVFDDMGSAMVLRGESICHTALLPSRSRLEGEEIQSKSQYLSSNTASS